MEHKQPAQQLLLQTRDRRVPARASVTCAHGVAQRAEHSTQKNDLDVQGGAVARAVMGTHETGKYLRMNEPMMVGVVMMVTRCSSTIFWNVPASWSA